MSSGKIDSFFDIVTELIDRLEKEESTEIEAAADRITETIMNDGLVHVFGTGHSHLLAEEVFGRAGGFAPVNAVLEPSLMLHNGIKYSKFEKMEGFGHVAWDYYDISEEDVMIVISNSGVNAVPVEMGLDSVENGTFTIAITSLNYSKYLEPAHSSGKKLFQVADLVIDNKGVPGDATLDLDNVPQKVGPTSTISGALILNSIFAGVAENIVKKGEKPPIFKSSNMEGANEHNKELFDRYKERINYF